jgi:hypothetical protein
MFDDGNLLYRESTSGARKIAYSGDVVPYNKLPISKWPFIVECKHGYENYSARFSKFDIIIKWINKANKEKTKEQHLLLLVVRFPSEKILFITEFPSKNNVHRLTVNSDKIYYVYYLDEITSSNFFEVFPDVVKECN